MCSVQVCNIVFFIGKSKVWKWQRKWKDFEKTVERADMWVQLLLLFWGGSNGGVLCEAYLVVEGKAKVQRRSTQWSCGLKKFGRTTLT